MTPPPGTPDSRSAARSSPAAPPPGTPATPPGARSSATPTPRGTLLLAPVLLALACGSPYPAPPATARAPVVDTLHGLAIADDYRWLEDQDGPETRAWIAAQNAYAELIVGETPLRDGIAARLRELMDVPGALFPRRAGDFEYFTFRRPGAEVAAIHRRPAPEERQEGPIDPTGDFEVVIDPLDLDPTGTTSVSIRDFSPDGDLMIYAVRDGGQDEVEIRVRDLAAGEDLPDRLPNFLYGGVSFNREGTGFRYVSRSRETGGRVRLHILGTEVEDDAELFGEGHGPEKFVGFSEGGDGRYMVYTVQHGWARTDVYLQDAGTGGAPTPIVVGAPARFRTRFVEDELWVLTNLDAPNNRILALDAANPAPDPANWRVVLPETDDLLTGYQIIGDHIYADYLRSVSSRIVRHEMTARRTARSRFPSTTSRSCAPGEMGAPAGRGARC